MALVGASVGAGAAGSKSNDHSRTVEPIITISPNAKTENKIVTLSWGFIFEYIQRKNGQITPFLWPHFF